MGAWVEARDGEGKKDQYLHAGVTGENDRQLAHSRLNNVKCFSWHKQTFLGPPPLPPEAHGNTDREMCAVSTVMSNPPGAHSLRLA